MALAGLIMGYVSLSVIPLILIVATISVPSLLRSRQAAQESAAVSQLRTINTAEVTYLSSEGKGSYGSIRQLIAADLLDERYGSVSSGYTFSVVVDGTDYIATATPVATNTGRYGYFSTSDGVIRYQQRQTTTCTPCFPVGQAGAPVE